MELLGAVIDAKGKEIKQQLFEHQLASLIQRQKAATEDIACPECQKRSIFKGYQQRQLKTKFGPVFFVLPRLCVANRDAHIFLPHQDLQCQEIARDLYTLKIFHQLLAYSCCQSLPPEPGAVQTSKRREWGGSDYNRLRCRLLL